LAKKSKINLKNKILKLRTERKITQNELAMVLGVTRQTIIALEKQKYSPSLILAIRLSTYFGKKVEEVFQI